jgi:hypothetical protein
MWFFHEACQPTRFPQGQNRLSIEFRCRPGDGFIGFGLKKAACTAGGLAVGAIDS